MVKVSTVFNALMYLYFLVISFYTLRGHVEIFGILMPDFLVVSLVFFVLIIPFYIYKRDIKNPSNIYWLFSFIIFYAAFGVFFYGDTYLSNSILVTPLMAAFFAMLIPFSFSKLFTLKTFDVRKSIFNVSLIITSSIIFYIIYSGFQITDRLSTSIGGAAVLHVPLLLTMSVYLANIKVNYKKARSILLFSISMIFIVLTGSRTGFFIMVLFIILNIINIKKPLRTLGFSAFIGFLSLLIYRFLPTDRYLYLSGGARSINTETSISVIKDPSFNPFFGKGSGSIWPWFAYESGYLPVNLSSLIETGYGLALSNPHSVFMGTIVELGIIALIPLILIFTIILKALFNSFKKRDMYTTTIIMGVLCTTPAFTLDYYLFKNFAVSTIWWHFVFLAVSIPYINNKKPKEE